MKYVRDEIGIELLGKKIRQLRKQQKITQSQLAFEAGIPRNQVVSIELGKINTGVSTIFRISKVLNISPKDFFDFDYPLDTQ